MGISDKELNKIVKTTDVSQYWSKKRVKYFSPANVEAAKYDKYYGIQRMMSKITKSYGWRVHSQKFDKKTKSFDVVLMENAKISETKHLTYEDICKFMWWHSFEVAGEDILEPKPFTYDEREAVERPLVEATRARDAKKAAANAKAGTEKAA